MPRKFEDVQLSDDFAAHQDIGLFAEFGSNTTAGGIPNAKLLVLGGLEETARAPGQSSNTRDLRCTHKGGRRASVGVLRCLD